MLHHRQAMGNYISMQRHVITCRIRWYTPDHSFYLIATRNTVTQQYSQSGSEKLHIHEAAYNTWPHPAVHRGTIHQLQYYTVIITLFTMWKNVLLVHLAMFHCPFDSSTTH